MNHPALSFLFDGPPNTSRERWLAEQLRQYAEASEKLLAGLTQATQDWVERDAEDLRRFRSWLRLRIAIRTLLSGDCSHAPLHDLLDQPF